MNTSKFFRLKTLFLAGALWCARDTFAQVNQTIGTLAPGESVTITWDVTITSPPGVAAPQLSQQGAVSGANFATVNTDDPETVALDDPTLTALFTSFELTAPGDVAQGSSVNSPAGQAASHAIDNSATTKYLNFDKLNAGLTLFPSGIRAARTLTLISAGDAPERDPRSFTLEGSTDGINFTPVASGEVPAFAGRNTIQSISFANAAAYPVYRVIFPTVADAGTANSMQIAEVELLPYGEITSAADTVSISLPPLGADARGVARLFDRDLGVTNKLEISLPAGGNTMVDLVPATGATVLKGFELIGAADDVTFSGRRPSNVSIAGSADGVNYTVLSTVTPAAPSLNLQLQEFQTFANTTAYARYRIIFGPPVSGPTLQVGELRLFGENAPPPVPGADTVHRQPGRTIKIPLATLLVNDTGTAGLAVDLTAVAATSTGGVPLQLLNGVVLYAPAINYNSNDTFTYSLSDGFSTASGVVNVVVDVLTDTPSGNITSSALVGPSGAEQMRITIAGIPGRSYQLQTTSSVATPVAWTNLGLPQTAPANGQLPFLDPAPASPRFYRVIEALNP